MARGPDMDSRMVSVDGRSHPLAVRDMLARLMTGIAGWPLSAQALQHVELVAAEALNNVIEHACNGQPDISVRATAHLDPPSLCLEVVDHGAPMPDFVLPKQARSRATRSHLGMPRQALPEGGWGWMLIRDLTEAVRYERHRDGNHLHIRMSIG